MCSKDRPLSKSVKPGEDVFGYDHLSSFLVSAESFLRVSSTKSITNKSIKDVKYNSDDAEPYSGVEDDSPYSLKKAIKG